MLNFNTNLCEFLFKIIMESNEDIVTNEDITEGSQLILKLSGVRKSAIDKKNTTPCKSSCCGGIDIHGTDKFYEDLASGRWL